MANWHTLCPFCRGRSLYHLFTFTVGRGLLSGRDRSTHHSKGRKSSFGGWLARTGVVFLVTSRGRLSITAECISSPHLDVGPGRWRPPAKVPRRRPKQKQDTNETVLRASPIRLSSWDVDSERLRRTPAPAQSSPSSQSYACHSQSQPVGRYRPPSGAERRNPDPGRQNRLRRRGRRVSHPAWSPDD